MSLSTSSSGCHRRITWQEATVSELVDGAKADQAAAWDELVDRFAPLVERRARSVGLSSSSTDDAVQQTWIKLFESLDTLRDPQRLPGWLAMIARNEAVNIIRRKGRTVPSDTLDDRASEMPSVDRGLVSADISRAVAGAVATLRPRQRDVVRTRYLEDSQANYDQISRGLGIPQGAIGPTLGRAMDVLRSNPHIVAVR